MPYINTDYQPRAYWNTPPSARTLAPVAVVSAKVNDGKRELSSYTWERRKTFPSVGGRDAGGHWTVFTGFRFQDPAERSASLV